MKNNRIQKQTLFLFLTLIIISCARDDGSLIYNDPINFKIMPLGDSRVDGSNSLQGHQSYRYELWKLLTNDGVDFDFIGPEIDLTNYPSYFNQTFDSNHAGFGGYTSANILNSFTQIVDPNNLPDIVLLGIGGNDLLANVDPQEIIQNIHLIVDFMQALNPNMIIFIEQIAPGKSNIMTNFLWSALNEFNDQIAALTEQQTTETSTVIFVNMAENWLDSYLADNVHYSQSGALLVAQRYYEALFNFIHN